METNLSEKQTRNFIKENILDRISEVKEDASGKRIILCLCCFVKIPSGVKLNQYCHFWFILISKIAQSNQESNLESLPSKSKYVSKSMSRSAARSIQENVNINLNMMNEESSAKSFWSSSSFSEPKPKPKKSKSLQYRYLKIYLQHKNRI